MRSDVQEVFKLTPHDKQVMMFSATLDKEVRPICKKFMTDVSSDSKGKASFFTSDFGIFRIAGNSDRLLLASPIEDEARRWRPESSSSFSGGR